jgi:similar to stage IV sporulation protein
VSFVVSLAHADKVKKLLSNFEYTASQNYNLSRGINFFLNRIALSISVLVCTAVFFILDGFVYTVCVNGADGELTAGIYSYLNEIGIKRFTAKRYIADTDIANGIIKAFPNVAHSNVRVDGNTLTVTVLPAENNPAEVPQNVYSKYNAVIKRVMAASGRAIVEVGDVVRAGDLLVENAYPNTVIVIGEVEKLDISII